MRRLSDQTVFADLLAPVEGALARVRGAETHGRTLGMGAFIALGVLRHLQGIATLREQVQALLHLDMGASARPPLARSTWSDALACAKRLSILKPVVALVYAQARARLPDRLADLPGLGSRAVFAMDGTYQGESAHYHPSYPRAGGRDNPKGHALLSFYDLRLGQACDVHVETRSRHEVAMLRDYDADPAALTGVRGALWLVDRAFIDATFWDRKKRTLAITMITRMKSNLCVDSTEGLPYGKADPINAGVVSDLRVTLTSSPEPWRLVTYTTRRGQTLTFLTNDFSLAPGMVAFLYARRWDEEKCFDTWKNDLAQAKAWGKSPVAIANQAHLAILTLLLLALTIHTRLGPEGAVDTKAQRKQAKRQTHAPEHPDATERPDWAAELFRSTSKISRQVLRFFQYCCLMPASPALYQSHLRPLLEQYL